MAWASETPLVEWLTGTSAPHAGSDAVVEPASALLSRFIWSVTPSGGPRRVWLKIKELGLRK